MMKLTNRVSLFFLAALAVVLVVYSALFYAFVRSHLLWQFEQELYGALHSLVAAVEVEPEEVKWQPLEHTIALGTGSGADEVRWAVIGDGRQVVEQSRNAPPTFVSQVKSLATTVRPGGGTEIAQHGDWQLVSQRLVAPAPERSQRELDEFDEIVVVVARSAAPLNGNLNRLGLLVCTLSLAAWLLAAAAGRSFCRTALQPVFDMSKQARSMTGADFRSRLPALETGDELAELAVAFNTLLDRQQRAFEQQRRFAGNAAHELRTPLTVLLGQIDVSLRRARTPEEYHATLRLLRNETVELQKIVEALLFLARSEEDGMLPGAELLSLADWLPHYLHRWNDHPRREDIQPRLETGASSSIMASTALLARLLDNLIENAIKYSRPGSPIEVVLTSDGAEALLTVSDRGKGIAAEDQPAIFDPFFRTRAARDAGIAGSGLGLAIASRIALALGGALQCTSELDRGSRFTLRLPLRAVCRPVPAV